MASTSTGQLTARAAEVYDEFFVPALLRQWAGPVAHAARLSPGDEVLDVACGTGVLTREVLTRVRPDGRAVGLDLNDGMLAVARRHEPAIEWHQGRAEELPFPAASFDAVTSQFGLMFFTDRVRAVREMWRVVRPGGRLSVAVWAGIDKAPGYAALGRLLGDAFGPEAAAENDAPFALGDPARLRAVFMDAGVRAAAVTTRTGMARFPSLDDWMHVEVRGWTLADRVDDEGFERLRHQARVRLAPFVRKGGAVAFPISANVVTATKP